MTHCPICKIKLQPHKTTDFGAMIFMECPSCYVIWDYVGKGLRMEKILKNASLQQKTQAPG